MADETKSPTFAERIAKWVVDKRDVRTDIAAAQKVIDRHVLLKRGPCSPTVH